MGSDLRGCRPAGAGGYGMMGVLWAQLSRSGAAQPGEGPQPASSAGPERDRNSRRPEIVLMNAEKPPQWLRQHVRQRQCGIRDLLPGESGGGGRVDHPPAPRWEAYRCVVCPGSPTSARNRCFVPPTMRSQAVGGAPRRLSRNVGCCATPPCCAPGTEGRRTRRPVRNAE